MKTVKTLEESNRYEDGKRINVRMTETVTTLSDDLRTLAGYQAALAEHQEMLERLALVRPGDEVQEAEISRESMRLRQEMGVLREAVELQQNYLRGFEDGD